MGPTQHLQKAAFPASPTQAFDGSYRIELPRRASRAVLQESLHEIIMNIHSQDSFSVTPYTPNPELFFLIFLNSLKYFRCHSLSFNQVFLTKFLGYFVSLLFLTIMT